MIMTNNLCNWCNVQGKNINDKPYCNQCASFCKKECSRCHFPYPDIHKYFEHPTDKRCKKCNRIMAHQAEKKNTKSSNKPPKVVNVDLSEEEEEEEEDVKHPKKLRRQPTIVLQDGSDTEDILMAPSKTTTTTTAESEEEEEEEERRRRGGRGGRRSDARRGSGSALKVCSSPKTSLETKEEAEAPYVSRGAKTST